MALRGGVWAPGGTLGAVSRGWAVFRAVAPPEGGSIDLRSEREGPEHLRRCRGEVVGKPAQEEHVTWERGGSCQLLRTGQEQRGREGPGGPRGGGPAAQGSVECEPCYREEGSKRSPSGGFCSKGEQRRVTSWGRTWAQEGLRRSLRI